ncbi:MAG TPA: oligosaccharide flippase family protein, partial [Candidatus Acidoferrum sp.]|nr:oligosaccharide flippase family protein [Candidatus Acidoferrum sp.]
PRAAAAFYQALRVNVIVYIPAIIGVYLGAPFLASHLLGDVSYAPLFRVVAFDVFLSAGMLQVLVAALLGLQMFRETAVIGFVVNGLLRQVLIISLIVLMRNFLGLVVGWLISDAATVVIYLILTVRVLGRPRFDFSLSRLTRFYLPLEFAQIVGFAQTWFDRAFLVVFVSLATLGIYNAALTAFSVLIGISSAMTNMLLPAYSSIRRENTASMRDSIRLGIRYANFTLAPLAFALLATAKPALTLFVGQEYVSGSLPLAIFALAFAVTAFTTPFNPLFLAIEATLVFGSIVAVSVVISLVAAFVLLPVLGIVGVAIARALAIVLIAVLQVLILRKKIALDLDLHTIAKTFIAGTVMVTVMLGIQFVYYNKFMLPVYLLLGGVAYLLMLRSLKAVTVEDMDLLRNFLGKRLSRICSIITWILVPHRRSS